MLNADGDYINMEGKLIMSTSNFKELNVGLISEGTYLLEIMDVNTGQKIVEKILIGR